MKRRRQAKRAGLQKVDHGKFGPEKRKGPTAPLPRPSFLDGEDRKRKRKRYRRKSEAVEGNRREKEGGGHIRARRRYATITGAYYLKGKK